MNTQAPDPILRNKYLGRWKGGSWAIFCVAAFSVVNILLFLFGSESYFLFTAYIPYLLGVLGVSYWKGGEDVASSAGVGAFLLSISAVIVILYFVCWFFSKKKSGWLIAGTVLFSLDTLFLLYDMLLSEDMAWYVMDVVIHALVIVELAMGIHAAAKLKKLPDEAAIVEELSSEQGGTDNQPGISDEFKD